MHSHNMPYTLLDNKTHAFHAHTIPLDRSKRGFCDADLCQGKKQRTAQVKVTTSCQGEHSTNNPISLI